MIPALEHSSLLTIVSWLLMMPIAIVILVRMTAFWAEDGPGTVSDAKTRRDSPAAELAPHQGPPRTERGVVKSPVLKNKVGGSVAKPADSAAKRAFICAVDARASMPRQDA